MSRSMSRARDGLCQRWCSRCIARDLGFECGLLTGRKEKAEEGIDACGPRSLVMRSAFGLEVAEILALLPSTLEERVAKHAGVGGDFRTLLRPRVEPDAEGKLVRERAHLAHDHAVIPPDGGREAGQVSEDAGVAEAHVQREQPTQRRTGHRGGGRSRKRAVLSVDVRLYLL